MGTTVAVLLGHRVTASDAIPPAEILAFLPDTTVRFVAAEPGPKLTDNGTLHLVADTALDELPHPDVVVVPADAESPRDARVLDWLRGAAGGARCTLSVCAGALTLGAAGLLTGRRATTHWAAMPLLAGFGAEAVSGKRWVHDGTVITSAGNSAGIDASLYLAAQLAGEEAARAVQLCLEYDPQPPFDSGDPRRASEAVLRRAREMQATLLAAAGYRPA